MHILDTSKSLTREFAWLAPWPRTLWSTAYNGADVMLLQLRLTLSYLRHTRNSSSSRGNLLISDTEASYAPAVANQLEMF